MLPVNMIENKIENKIERYTTKNLNIAAYLYASGIHFTGAEKIKYELFFSFSPKKKAEILVNDYFSGTASVNPRDLFARLHDLKDLIFNQK
jgi:hypothetical protein